MSGQIEQNLEQQLASLTAWDGETPQLWRRALKSTGQSTTEGLSLLERIFAWPLPAKLAACFAVGVVAVTAAAFITSLSSSFSVPLADTYQVSPQASRRLRTEVLRSPLASGTPASVVPDDGYRAGHDLVLGASEAKYLYTDAVTPAERAEAPSASLPQTPPPADTSATPMQSSTRQVVRTATIELTAPDVRTVFLKAAMLVRDATGEYVQDSALTGEGATAYANLTLRVAADRLHAVLQALRELGTVTVERTEGQDVTAQVVDLEARLRNERRVETELLELMDRRKDAPLKEILELREQLSRVRGEIERLTAQRDHLGHLVSLATVLVIVRGTEAGAVSPGTPLGQYFRDACRRAWHGSLTFLADTLAIFIRLLVGGIVWWVLLVVIVLMIRRWRRRLRAAARHEE